MFHLGRAWGALAAFGRRGRLAQLEERLVYTEEVGSSNLSSPTILSPVRDNAGLKL